MTTATGIISWQAQASAFGDSKIDMQIASTRLAAENNHRFPGQYYDAETGLHQNYFRDYEASIGRYVQRDPIGLRGGINVFGYVGGGPLVFVDPLGLYWPDAEALMLFEQGGCVVVVDYDNSFEETKKIVGDPTMIGSRAAGSGGRIGRGIMIMLFTEEVWQQVTYNFHISVTDLTYHLECTETDECGKEYIRYVWGATHYDRVETRLPDTVRDWTITSWGDGSIPLPRRGKRR